jgi:polysaccharide export outer membrane protein
MLALRSLLLALALLALASPAAIAQGKLRPGDVLDLRVTGVPGEFAQEVSMAYTVLDDGTVRLPYIGELKAAGSTIGEFSRAVERQFVTQEIFTNPVVIIALPASARTVSVGGGVRSPGAVPWSPDLTLSEAIVRAGGSDFNDLGKVKVIHEGKTSVFNLKRAEHDPAQNPKLSPGDEVKVPQ